jgi:UDP-N-acetylglucosamine 2-epimerase (non-hydrolysing)/GDP/UDP-N,N'-diacetylbacillosamine 2-epimerase (hydrolysing)
MADAALGNSSSALIEAPAVALPAVNVGDRQLGRRREANVVDVVPDPSQITAALQRALSPAFRAGLSPLQHAPVAPRIVDALLSWTPPRPPRKPSLAPGR